MAVHAFHPGEYLAEDLDERGMTGADLARALSIPRNRVSKIINGKRAVTVDTALRLARWIGSSPHSWLNLQQSHDLRVSEDCIGDEIRRTVIPDATPPDVPSP